MPLPTYDTLVSYASGATEGVGTVLYTEILADGRADHRADGRAAILLDATPCHPVDAGWPDQGPDRATMTWNGSTVDVVDCVVGATDGSSLFLGSEIPVRKGTDGWAFLVVHLITGPAPAVGQQVTVTVDAEHRGAISLGHTACHLASLALNRAMADRWTKELAPDALGSPNFDQAGNDSSTIVPHGSVDNYRMNKSLRRKGFTTDGLAEALPAISVALNAQLTSWVASAAPVRIDRDGDGLTDRRYWVCTLPDGVAVIPCGGTHVTSLAELVGLRATLQLIDVDGTPVLTMRTTTTTAAATA